MLRRTTCLVSLIVTFATVLHAEDGLLGDPTGDVLSELLTELDLVEVALQDQPTPSPPAARPSRRSVTSAAAPSSFRRSRTRLARAPSVFGDFLYTGTFTRQMAFNERTHVDIPMAGGSRRIKIAEHNKALPDDRVYFLYNHFHNALNVAQIPAPGAPPINANAFSIDRYLFGAEKTFLDGDWSVELRMPFTNGLDFATPDFRLAGGEVGDLSVILKHLLYVDDTSAISAGLGINTPTGSDAQVFLPFQTPPPVEFTLGNEALHLLPFVGFLCDPDTGFYFHGFVQADIATKGNPVLVTGGGVPIADGRLNDQTLLYVDAGAGYWLFRDATASCLTAAAVTAEFHYTTALQDADTVVLPGIGDIGSRRNRFDVVNATVGLHVELREHTNLRVGGVFPLADELNRFFDSEVQVALIHKL